MAQVCRSLLFCRRRLVAWAHFLMWSVSSFSLFSKGLFTCLNFKDWIIFSMSSSKSFNSSVGDEFFVDLKP